jgi:acylphosphatase
VLVTGRVQGVGFRHATVDVAASAGLVGWVRNLPDGRVEALLQGPEPAVASVMDWIRRGGPPTGRVHALDSTPASPDPTLTAFSIRR